MANTKFIDNITKVTASWLNDVNDTVYGLPAAGGAALVGFQQAGTGAVARTVQDRLRDVVSVKDFGAKGDGVADDTAAIQAAIDSFATHKLPIYFPSGTYRVTAPINLRVAGTSNSDKLWLHGAGDLNTSILMDNDAAAAVFKYDNGWKSFDVANCSTTSGSSTVTTTGDFIAAGVSVGMFLHVAGVQGNVTAVNSAAQIAVDRNATMTGSGASARFYDTTTTALNRLRICDFYVRHSQSVVEKTSWHAAYAFDINGVVNSEFENLRIQGFTKGFKSLGGWINSFKNVTTNACREGFDIELATYRWHFERCATVTSGGSGTWFGTKIVNSGGLSFVNHIVENDQIGMQLAGVHGCQMIGGNWESTAYSWTLDIRGIPWSIADESTWSQGIGVSGVRFYNTLGVLVSNGVKGVRITNNAFVINAPPFTPGGDSWIRTTGELNLLRDIDESGNVFPVGWDNYAHILQPPANATLADAQVITRDGHRYVNGTPYYGKYWKKGDRLFRQPTDVTAGSYEGWVCTVDSSGVDGSATWKQFGTVQA